MSNKRKNVLIIMTDQQRATEIFEEEGEGKLDLPGMRRLRRHGISFRNATCNSCMCSPSRTTMFTGQYPAKHGVTQTLSYDGLYAIGQHSLANSVPNMGNIFANAGYDTQYRGKWHLSKAPNHPENPDALMPSDVALFGFKGWIPPDAGEDAKPEHFGGGWPNQDAEYISQAREWLEDRKAKASTQPFLMVLSLVNPHDVLAFPKSWQYGYHEKDWNNGRLGLPPSFDEDLEANHKPSAQAQLLNVSAASLGPLPTPEDKKHYVNFYGSVIEKVDRQIDDLLDIFYDDDDNPNEFFNDTLIIRMSDHGEMGMSHGGLRQKAYTVYEETLRVPMIWSNPEMFPDPVVTDELACLVDVLPTLCRSMLAPDDVPAATREAFAGTNLEPLFSEPNQPVQHATLFTFDDIRASSSTEEHVVNAPDRIRCVRTKNWKYAEYFSADSTYAPEYELYNLNEPTTGNSIGKNGLEYDNLYYNDLGEPRTHGEIADVIADMQKLLRKEMEAKLY